MTNFSPEQITAIVSTLEKRIKEARRQEAQMLATLKVIQDLCDHDYVEEGHDHNYVYYRCSICGKRIRE
jgi:hypothetical protein